MNEKRRLGSASLGPALAVLLLAGTALTPPAVLAADGAWAGHVRWRGQGTWPGGGPRFTETGELRLLARPELEVPGLELECQYEAQVLAGDLPASDGETPAGSGAEADERRLLDLSAVASGHDHLVVRHRLDRLNLSLSGEWGRLTLGRQAVTWGNGMVFNPMDLFSPFAPTDVFRDYKLGDDMVLWRGNVRGAEGQALWVPRREPESGDLRWEESSLAGKVHWRAGELEWDVMAGVNHDWPVLGAGISGNAGQALWRLDAVRLFAPSGDAGAGHWRIVANVETSWVWLDRNMTGLVELYYNGLGADGSGSRGYAGALAGPEPSDALLDALDRGEIFTLGRCYAAVQTRMELHPLVMASLTVIANLLDPSVAIQPWISWNLADNADLLAGVTIHAGGPGTEYGGFDLAEGVRLEPADAAWLWLTVYF